MKRLLVNAVLLGAGSGTATATVASGGDQRKSHWRTTWRNAAAQSSWLFCVMLMAATWGSLGMHEKIKLTSAGCT
jgi:hypothetical protein